jgi:hypothetical protein|tara:strand:+ start:10123 stop:10344 length:222 start_codon:yes stop_codon:yes gene_type:complete
MWVALILACGTLNGEVTPDCRSFAAERNVASEQECYKQIAIGYQVMLQRNWTMIDFYCLNWEEKPEAIKGEPA